MITKIITIGNNIRVCREDGQSRERREIYGLSTDTKPVDKVENADVFYEMDTQVVFMFDEANKTWLAQ